MASCDTYTLVVRAGHMYTGGRGGGGIGRVKNVRRTESEKRK